MLQPYEIKLAAKLLALAGEWFEYHDDYTFDLFDSGTLTESEYKSLLLDYPELEVEDTTKVQDFQLMNLLAKKLEQEYTKL